MSIENDAGNPAGEEENSSHPSIRDALTEALRAHQSTDQTGGQQAADGSSADPAAVQQGEQRGTRQPRGNDGRFTKSQQGAPQTQAAPAAQTQAKPGAQTPATQTRDPAATTAGDGTAKPSTPTTAPESWNQQGRELFSKASPELQAYILQRDKEQQEGFRQFKEQVQSKVQVAEAFAQTVQPYLAMMRAEGVTPIQAVASLLNMAHVMRAGTPTQKMQLLRQTAQEFGIDLKALADLPANATDPLAPILPELHQLRSQIASLTQGRQAEQEASFRQRVEAFKNARDDQGNPKHPHFEEVRQDMAALIETGRAHAVAEQTGRDVLDVAYDMAIHANPGVRSKVLAAQQAREQAEREREAREANQRKQQAAGSVAGGPGIGVFPQTVKPKSIRANLEEAFNAATGRV